MIGVRQLMVILAVAALVGLAAGCGGDEAPPVADDTVTATTAPEPTTPETTESTPKPKPKPKPKPTTRQIVIVVDQGRPRGGIKRPTLEKGEEVVLIVRADVGDEVHIHGYERTKALTPGRPARIPLTATLAGRFEVELHHPDALLAVLEIRP